MRAAMANAVCLRNDAGRRQARQNIGSDKRAASDDAAAAAILAVAEGQRQSEKPASSFMFSTAAGTIFDGAMHPPEELPA